MTELVRYEAARQALAAAFAVDEVLEIRDHAEAMRHAARIAKDRDLEIKAAQIRFRADRRLGELIAAQKETIGLAQGRRSDLVPAGNEVADGKITLAEAGIDRKLSMRAQRVAALPAKKFEALLEQHAEEMRTGVGRVAMDLLKVNADQEGRQARRELAKTLSDASAVLPTGRQYPVIYADPPWQRKQGVTSRSYENHYPTMTWSEICALPVRDIVLPDAWLFLWIPRAHAFALHEIETEVTAVETGEIVRAKIELPLAWAVAKSWGFDAYSTAFVWTKTEEEHPDEAGGAVLVRDQDELLLMFKRGRGLPKPDNGEKFGSNHRERSRPLGHSTKPQHYRRMIATMAGRGVPCLEMFARFDAENPPPPGWDLWGNQASPSHEIVMQAAVDTSVSATESEPLPRPPVVFEANVVADPTIGDMIANGPVVREIDNNLARASDRSERRLAGNSIWIADGGIASPAADRSAPPAANGAPECGKVDSAARNPDTRAVAAVRPAARPGSESSLPIVPIVLSEFDALKVLSDFCHPKRAELAPQVGPSYAERGLAIQQSATGQWMLREAGWSRLRELEAEQQAREPAAAIEPHPLDIPEFLRRTPKAPQIKLEPQLELALARIDRVPPEIVDGKLQTRMPLAEEDLAIQAALLAIDAGGIADSESVRHAESEGYLHVTTKSIRITDEGRAWLAQLVTPASARQLEERA
jgi:N6-adenosine-specific RNA methylase IME4